MPELVWTDCEDLPGCKRMDPNWYVKVQIYLGFAHGYRAGGASRLGIGTEWDDGSEWRHALYDERWRPLAVWRGRTGDCNGVGAIPATDHVCFVSAKLGGVARAGLLSWDELKGEPILTYDTRGRLIEDCTDELMITGDTVGQYFVYDFASREETPLLVPSGIAFTPAANAGAAFFSRWHAATPNREGLDGWIWTRSAGPQPLVTSETGLIADIRSDGTHLTWLELDTPTIDRAATGVLWTSALGTSPAELAPREVREVPKALVTPRYKAVGGGMYALVEQDERDQSIQRLHVFRLTDGRHWLVPFPADPLPSAIIWIDAEELLVETTYPSGASYGLLRQRLSALGKGD